MRSNAVFLCALLLLLCPVTVFAESFPPGGFTAVADIQLSGSKEYKAVAITPEIYAATNENLADVMLIANDTMLPYFINNSQVVTNASNKIYELKQTGTFLKDGFRYYDCELLALEQNDILATSLNFATGDEFVKQAELFGGYDGIAWEKVTDEKLYNISGNSNLKFSFSSGQKYTHYRIKLPEEKQGIVFERMWLEYNTETVTRVEFSNKITPEFTVSEDGKVTVITVSSVKHLPLAGIEIDTDTMFKREVSVLGSYDTLYNLMFDGEEYKKLDMRLNGEKSDSGDLEIRIYNQDDMPLNIKAVTVEYLCDTLVFKAPESGDVKLYFGNADIVSCPRYDIESYKEYIITDGYDIVTIQTVSRLSHETQEQDKVNYSFIFNATLIIVAVALIIIILKKIQKS